MHWNSWGFFQRSPLRTFALLPKIQLTYFCERKKIGLNLFKIYKYELCLDLIFTYVKKLREV